jgi:hypothetical protein
MELKREEKVAGLLKECADLYLTKNADYGSAYIKTQQIMSLLIPTPVLESDMDQLSYQLIAMMVSKLCRVSNLLFRGKVPAHESAVDSLRDLSVYSAMLAGELPTQTRSKR